MSPGSQSATAPSSELTFITVPSSTPEAQACQNAYFAELSARFKNGFNVDLYSGKGTPAASGQATPSSTSTNPPLPSQGKEEEEDDSAQFTPPRGAFVLVRRGPEGQVVACGGVRLLEPGIAEVKRMWVSPEARGQRVASRLLAHLEALAVSEVGAHAIRLDTRHELDEAMKFYPKQGYVEVPRYNNNPYATHFFEKKV